jgi:hypothetical protein
MKIIIGSSSHEKKGAELTQRLRTMGFNAWESNHLPEANPPADLFLLLYCGDQASTILPNYNLEQYLQNDGCTGIPVLLVRCGAKSRRLNLVGLTLTFDSSDEEFREAIAEATKQR